MLSKKIILWPLGVSLAAIISLAAYPLNAQVASESERLETLERAIELLQKRNAQLEADFAQSDGTNGGRTAFSATDIFINWHQFPAAQIKIGQYKAPFGLEQLTSTTSLDTIERTLPTGAITPQRQIGVELWGKPLTNIWPAQENLLTYYGGIFNGNGRNINTNDDKLFHVCGPPGADAV